MTLEERFDVVLRKGRIKHLCPNCETREKAVSVSGKRLGYCRECHNRISKENREVKKTDRTNFKWSVKGASAVYHRYKKGAEKRGLVWELSKREFEQLIQMECDLCGVSASDSEGMKHKTPFNGIDRRDSDLGYTLANSVPCCWDCNRMKGEETLKETLKHCERMLSWNRGMVDW